LNWNVYPGSGFRVRILIFHPSRIPDSGVKKAPDPGSRSATLANALLKEEKEKEEDKREEVNELLKKTQGLF
jgi:hypothetical protein